MWISTTTASICTVEIIVYKLEIISTEHFTLFIIEHRTHFLRLRKTFLDNKKSNIPVSFKTSFNILIVQVVLRKCVSLHYELRGCCSSLEHKPRWPKNGCSCINTRICSVSNDLMWMSWPCQCAAPSIANNKPVLSAECIRQFVSISECAFSLTGSICIFFYRMKSLWVILQAGPAIYQRWVNHKMKKTESVTYGLSPPLSMGGYKREGGWSNSQIDSTDAHWLLSYHPPISCASLNSLWRTEMSVNFSSVWFSQTSPANLCFIFSPFISNTCLMWVSIESDSRLSVLVLLSL